jgi:bacillithiol system protein YtxJ
MAKVELMELTEEVQLDHVLARSEERPQLLFKHSLTCPVSTNAHNAFQEYLADAPEVTVDYSWLAVQKARPVSLAVAERVEIRHESPQALLIHERRAVWHASHWDITKDSLARAIGDRAAPVEV